MLYWLERSAGKKTIVLISTGVDTSPPSASAALQTRLRLGDVRVLCVSTSGPLRNGKQGAKMKIQETQDEFSAADRRLKAIAERTHRRARLSPRMAKFYANTKK